MRYLTEKQEIQLKEHILKMPVDYIELFNELFDHYATAYELGNEDFEATLNNLDKRFTRQRVKDINTNVPKKTQKALKKLMWREFQGFWRWPQIAVTSFVSLLVLVLAYQLNPQTSIYIIGTILITYSLVLLISAFFIKKKIEKKNYKSAHIKAVSHIANIPVSLFNLTIFLPILIGTESNRMDLWSASPFVPALLFLSFLFFSHIIYKVYKTKVRFQFI